MRQSMSSPICAGATVTPQICVAGTKKTLHEGRFLRFNYPHATDDCADDSGPPHHVSMPAAMRSLLCGCGTPEAHRTSRRPDQSLDPPGGFGLQGSRRWGDGRGPFLVPELAALAVTEAKSYGLKTHVVTSGYWAKSTEEAGQRLEAVGKGGLDELCISYDDSHAKYVKFERIGHAYRAAIARGIKVRFLITQEPGSVIEAGWMRREVAKIENYDAELTSFTVGAVLSTGRASTTSTLTQIASRAASTEKYLGPCPIVFRRLAVNPEGNMLACCGTVPFYEDLCIGNVNTHTLSEAVAGMYNNLLLR